MGIIDDLVNQIEKLPLSARAQIVDTVIRDMASPDPQVDKLWAKEASIRWGDYKQKKVKAIPYEEVLSKYKRT